MRIFDVGATALLECKLEMSGSNLLTAEAAANVRHHVAMSMVGTDRLSECEYCRTRLAQENLIKASKIHYAILRATKFRPAARLRAVREMVGPLPARRAPSFAINATNLTNPDLGISLRHVHRLLNARICS